MHSLEAIRLMNATRMYEREVRDTAIELLREAAQFVKDSELRNRIDAYLKSTAS